MIRQKLTKPSAPTFGRDKKLLYSLMVVSIVAIMTSWGAVRKGESWLLEKESEASAIQWVAFVRNNIPDFGRFLNGDQVLASDQRIFEFAGEAGNVFRYKLFGPDGLIVFASRASDLGTTTTKPYFFNIVKKGNTFVKIANKEDFGQKRMVVSEAYVPIMKHDRFMGAVEVYVDMTARADALRYIGNLIFLGVLVLLATLGAVYGIFIWFNVRARNQELQEIIESRRNVIDAQAARQESEARFRAVFDNAPVAISLKDTEGSYFLVNRKFEDLAGSRNDEILGKKSGEIFHDNFAQSGIQHDREIIQGRIPTTYEEEFEAASGTYSFLTTKFPIINKNGELKAIGAIHTDITERKQAEVDLRIAMKKTEQARAQAMSAAEKAAAASQTKSEFLANMSHELRTPLNALLGFAEMIERESLGPLGNENYTEYVKIIGTSGRHLLTVINDILDYSKIEAGKLDLDQQPFMLSEVTDSTVELLASTVQEKAIELACFVAREVPMNLVGDAPRLRQVLLNLISNAVKFTEKGGVKVEVSVEAIDGDEVVLRFEISDTGIGLEKAGREFLFDKFNQADVSTTKKYGGTGLGLAISKQLVELMNGEIGVDSQLGQGSTFWFTVALAKQAKAGKDTLAKAAEVMRGRRTLVADDNPINRQICEKYLEILGAEVTTVTDAQAALSVLAEAANEAPIEVVIIDHSMPNIDGEELGRRIRAEAKYDELKMVLSSSSGLVLSHRNARALGFDAALPKPLHRTVVLNCLAYLYGVDLPQYAAETPENNRPASRRDGLHVLVAEDNKINQLLLETMLYGSGYKVDIVNNGQEAVEAVRDHAYDLILMDVHMPELNGLDATRRIRQLPGAIADVPIIAVTAGFMQAGREKCHQAGMNDYVLKPIDKRYLLERIAFWSGTYVPCALQTPKEDNESGDDELGEDATSALEDLLDSIDDIASEQVVQKAKPA